MGVLLFGSGVGKLGELGAFLSGKTPLPPGERTGWLELCTIDAHSGSLWIGDPLLANAEDGCVVRVPNGVYCIEGIGWLFEGLRAVQSVRARLKSALQVEVGSPIGETGTDSAMIGICDLVEFDKACGDSDEVQEELEEKTQSGFGRITIKKHRKAVMVFVPSGGDGCGPVLQLIDAGTCVGFQHDFISEQQV